MMSRNLVTLGLVASLALSLGGCWPFSPTEPSQAELDQARVDAENKKSASEADQREANADENGLVATSDPRVFKATKVLPRPETAKAYPKPEYPALGYEHTYEGAEAVALYFQELIPYVANTADLTAFKEICSPQSDYCDHVIKGVTQNASEGNWSAGMQVTDLKIVKWGIPPDDKGKGEYSFIVSGAVGEHTHFDKPTMIYRKKPSYKIEAFTNLSFVEGRWIVVAAGSEKK